MTERKRPTEGVWLSEAETSRGRVPHARFIELVSRRDVTVHTIQNTTNAFGEFLFVTLSRRRQVSVHPLTFYGLGFHEARERWITDTWDFFESCQDRREFGVVPKAEALQHIREEEHYVASQSQPIKPTDTARLYAFLADLTDEDAALAELEDLGWPLLGLDEPK